MPIEITESPQVLYNASVPVTDLLLVGRRLYDDPSLVDTKKVVDTSLETHPEGYTKFAYHEGEDGRDSLPFTFV